MVAGRATLDEFRYVLTVSEMAVDGRLTDAVAKKLDDTRPRSASGTAAPTVEELRAALRSFASTSPSVRSSAAIRRSGRRSATSATRWRRSRRRRATPPPPDYARDASAHRHLRERRDDNPARADFLKAHPSIKSLVGGSEWEWVK
jgi:hypothetical protein